MGTRQTPTVEQIIEALSDTSGGPLMYLRENRAVAMKHAIAHLRRAYRTSTPKAEEWLLEAVSDGDSPLMLIETDRIVSRLTGADYLNLTRTPLDMPDAVHHAFQFDRQGRIVCMQHQTRPSAKQNFRHWIVRRDALQAMQSLVEADVAAAERERIELRALNAAEFDEHHGDDLEAFRSFVAIVNAALPGGGADHDCPVIEPDAISTYVSTSPAHAKLWGTPGSMTLMLRGNQISVAAKILREALGL